MKVNEENVILIVDDEPSVRESVAAYLEDCGMRVLTAEDGEEGVRIFENDSPDLILLDLRMPGMDGLDVMRIVTEKSPETPIIVISGAGLIDDAIESLRCGAWDFITKPVRNFPSLRHSIDMAFEKAALIRENREHRENLERKVAERTRQLKDAMERVEVANRVKNEFLANMSHEVRTPLNGILGMAQVLLDSELTDEHRRMIRVMYDSGEALLQIVNDILNLATIQAGDLEMEAKAFDLANVISTVQATLDSEIRRKQLDFRFVYDAPRRFIGDDARVRQILLNLLGNAVKFTDKGRLTVKVAAKRRTEEVTDVAIEVADTGEGIAADSLRTIFDLFTQGDGSSTRAYGGTGLGLTISKRLCELMGGCIKVESELGKGSTFRVTLPLAVDPENPPDEKFETRGEMPARYVGLIVEDIKSNNFVLEKMLQRRGVVVDSVEDGLQAVEALRKKRYDIVFMDLQLPRLNGYKAAKIIRDPSSGALEPNVPIIAVTAYAMRGDRERCMEAGMNEYVAKPIKLVDIDECLTMLEKSK